MYNIIIAIQKVFHVVFQFSIVSNKTHAGVKMQIM